MLQYVSLTVDLYDGSGRLPSMGSASFAPSATLTAAGTEVITQAPVTASFGGSSPPVVSLLATDSAGLLPTGWTWAVTFAGVPGNPAGFSFFLPFAGGASQRLSSLTPVASGTSFQAYLPLSGGTMTGPLTLAADPTAPLQAATKEYVDGFFARKAATSVSGFALQNGTPSIISWAVPSDGKQHVASIFASCSVTSAETGGGMICSATAPDGSNSSFVIINGNLGPGFRVNTATVSMFVVGAGTTVALQQQSALTGGAATVWAEIWGA